MMQDSKVKMLMPMQLLCCRVCLGAVTKTLVHVVTELPASRCCYATLMVTPFHFTTRSSAGSHQAFT